MSKRVRHQLSSAVFVIVQDQQGRVLMLRRNATGWMDGHWSLPAGALNEGETLRSAAVRELGEEVGLKSSAAALDHVHAIHCLTGGGDWVGHFFASTTWAGEPRLCEPDKHDALQWFDPAALPENVVPYVRLALNAVAQGRTYSEHGWDEIDGAA